MSMGLFTENTRVQVPAALHLCRLGYVYKMRSELVCDQKTNILVDEFMTAVTRINPDKDKSEIKALLDNLISVSANDDIGREFYEKIVATSGIRVIDFEHPGENSWICTTELPCEDLESHDEFRPDVTCFVNGLPLAFVEVKIPNNRDGILAERDRMNVRMANKVFRPFLNVTQLMIFSNNQEYDKDSRVPVQGAFYATVTKGSASFSVFRESDPEILAKSGYKAELDPEVEKKILKNRNCLSIRCHSEYITNQRPDTPTNRILTSMLSRDRFLFLLRYGFAYVDRMIEQDDGTKIQKLEKNVMRYQQLFATLAIRRTLDRGVNSGVIWHTQGSGKTALAFHNVKSLTDYYAAKETVAKFYFIVDRIDLLEQAVDEFAARGLVVRTAQSRDELMDEFKSTAPIENKAGKPEILVVNIQKFKDDKSKVVIPSPYNIRLQRVFFIDEAHRGYDPKGCFLSNLFDADRAAVKIAMTGTPLLKAERESCKVFGDYIDTYYYDKSIADGYTLRLMREDIRTDYKERIAAAFDEVVRVFGADKVRKSDINHDLIIEHETYVSALLDYIIDDLRKFRIQKDAKTAAGMIVCETNTQARNMFRLFNERFAPENLKPGEKPLRASLILHDEGDKQERKDWIRKFKKKEAIDILIVNNMLLTGFDAPRLKRLYLGRKLDGYALLQALTRVNRPYRDFKFGYIVDFANIKQNFEETNNMYLKELNRTTSEVELPEGAEDAGDALIVGIAEVSDRLRDARDALFFFDTSDLEEFRKQLDEVTDKEQLYVLRRKLEDVKALSNQVRFSGDKELIMKVEADAPNSIPRLIAEVSNRINRINLLENISHAEDVSGIINELLNTISFSFVCRLKEELQIVYNDLADRCQKVKGEFEINIDKKEDKYVSLVDDFKAFFRKRGITRVETRDEVLESIKYIDSVMDRIREINRLNAALKRKYRDDEKFVRIHKRIREANAKRSIPPEKPIISKSEAEICDNLNRVKDMVDEQIYENVHVLENEPVFTKDVLHAVSDRLMAMDIAASLEDRKFIRDQIAAEYLERHYQLVG